MNFPYQVRKERHDFWAILFTDFATNIPILGPWI